MKILRDYDKAEIQAIKDAIDNQRKLNLPTVIPVMMLELEVRDKEGNVNAVYRDRSRSYVRNFYNFCVYQQMGLSFRSLSAAYGAGGLYAKQTGGTEDAFASVCLSNRAVGNTNDYYYAATYGDTDQGIVAGSNGAAENFEDHALGTQIDHGNGAGELLYNATNTLGEMANYDAGTKTITSLVARLFDNQSGGVVTVEEVGIYAKLHNKSHTSSTVGYYMLVRDLISPAVDVPDNEELYVKYSLAITYPE